MAAHLQPVVTALRRSPPGIANCSGGTSLCDHSKRVNVQPFEDRTRPSENRLTASRMASRSPVNSRVSRGRPGPDATGQASRRCRPVTPAVPEAQGGAVDDDLAQGVPRQKRRSLSGGQPHTFDVDHERGFAAPAAEVVGAELGARCGEGGADQEDRDADADHVGDRGDDHRDHRDGATGDPRDQGFAPGLKVDIGHERLSGPGRHRTVLPRHSSMLGEPYGPFGCLSG
jgi:hypothetical protein